MVVVAAAPIVVALLPGHIPQVVFLIAGGVLIGPAVLDAARPDQVQLFANLGLGFLFLFAGYELDLRLLRDRPGRLAIASWLVTVLLAVAVVGVLELVGFVRAFLPVAIGLTTTALGTLLPILRENNMLAGPFGRYLFAAGAIGEMGPVLVIAVLLGHYGSAVEVAAVAAVAAAAFVLALMPRLVADSRFGVVISEGQEATTQTTLRLTVLLLVTLLFLSAEFGLDIVLGAFFAGMVLRRWRPGDMELLDRKLDAVGYGLFIPLFFVSSGMSLDLRSIGDAPGRLITFFALLLAVRGLPTLLVYRRDLPARRRTQLMLLTATSLPLLVALAAIGLDNGSMLPENAAALVGAGVLSVAVFPLLAVRLEPRARRPELEAPND
jgi:Kef-type K+ transport system membrane component KefB